MSGLLEALNTSGTAVIIVGDTGQELIRWYANVSAAAILGYTVDELYATPVMNTIAEVQRPLIAQLSASFRGGQPMPPALELLLQHKDGTHLPVEAALGVCEIDGTRVYAVVFRPSGGHQHQLSLLEADRIGLVAALAAGFAHEINNPLTSVLLNLRSLRKQLASLPDAVQPQALRCLDDITTGAERIASNVRALQTLATRSSTQEVDLAAVVTSALRLVAPTLEPRAQVIRHITSVQPVTGEESRIGQAVLAMMLFSSSGFNSEVPSTSNRIVVAVEQRAHDVVVEVSDNGHDLTAAEAQGAFDPFFRSSARGAGVGVGLGVARSVATTLGGEVMLAPRPGGGAVITMRLPAASHA
ncbi:MAG: PAS domain-containing sensor histidine kinase [Deltaproteobacteria bacterium]|nr:PAS domain-containing sensor histidine kinase [Deltaproteobacteria bacterium]